MGSVAVHEEKGVVRMKNDEIIMYIAVFMAIALTIAFAVLFYDVI